MKQREFAKLYNKNVKKIYNFIFFRVGGSKEVAEDITSEVFIKAVENIEKLDKEQNPEAWLQTVARNKLKNHYRDKKPMSDIETLAPFIEDKNAKNLELKTDFKKLLEKIRELSEPQKTIIQKKYIEGYSYKEIANMIRKKPGATRIMAMRAMKELKRKMKGI